MDSASHDLEKPLLVDDLPVLKRKCHARDVHILSCAFLLIFLAFGATQNLESTLITVSWVFHFLHLLCFEETKSWFLFNFFLESFDGLIGILKLTYQEKNLGTTSLGILYLSFAFFSLVASSVVQALGSKNSLILGTTGYWLFIAAHLKPTW